MKFILLDKVTELEVGRKIKAVKAVSLAEEYLADHFPAFPVLPGVLMVEGLVQTAAMLVRVTNNFRHSMIVLEEARNVKYKSFVKPGSLLRMEVQAKAIDEQNSTFVGASFVDDQPMVEARLKLRHFNLADENPEWASVDTRIIQEMKQRAQLAALLRLLSGGKAVMTICREDICEKVGEILVDALGVDDDEITDDSSLMGDLGAESIDFLDIVFRLEKAFEIKIPREELFPPENLLNDAQYVSNGKLTETGLEKLREQMPHVDFTEFARNPDLNKMPDLFRVKSICDYIESKVNAG